MMKHFVIIACPPYFVVMKLIYKYFNSYKPGILFLWDIGKQYSPRCDAAERGVPSGAILFA